MSPRYAVTMKFPCPSWVNRATERGDGSTNLFVAVWPMPFSTTGFGVGVSVFVDRGVLVRAGVFEGRDLLVGAEVFVGCGVFVIASRGVTSCAFSSGWVAVTGRVTSAIRDVLVLGICCSDGPPQLARNKTMTAKIGPSFLCSIVSKFLSECAKRGAVPTSITT